MALFTTIAVGALAGMMLAPAGGPAFVSLNPPANIVDGARTTTKTARLPATVVDFACKGQAWGDENLDCLRAIAEQSGRSDGSGVRLIAAAEPLTTIPNIF